MRPRELMDAQDELRAVEEALCELDVDISSAYLGSVGLGCVKKELILGDGIEAAAELFKIPRLEARSYQDDFDALYFTVGGVSVVEYRRRDPDAQTP